MNTSIQYGTRSRTGSASVENLMTPAVADLLMGRIARIEIGGTAANYLSRPAKEDEVARNMPRLLEMWPAHDSHMEHNGVRHVIVFEPLDAKT